MRWYKKTYFKVVQHRFFRAPGGVAKEQGIFLKPHDLYVVGPFPPGGYRHHGGIDWMGMKSRPRYRSGEQEYRWYKKGIGLTRAGLYGAFLVTCLVLPHISQAAPVGTYVCSVDNCRKHHLAQGDRVLDACKTGVENAVESGPTSAACLQMCSDRYPDIEGALHKACADGCSLFESACLRDGKIPPKEYRHRIENRPKSNW